MKKFAFTLIIALLTTTWTTSRAQEMPAEYLGLPGDNLNLYAVMKLFQESETLEGFERSLNDENSRINNLDLNGDNLVDYISVIDYPDGDDHTIVLRVALDRNDTQDLAVFTVHRLRNGSVQVQLIGDEELYGKNYIIEPNYEETPNPGYSGANPVTVYRTTYYDVESWPLIRFMFTPGYVAWHSSWYWGYYPSYFNPWKPYYWHYYYGYHSHWYNQYYSFYRHCDRPRYGSYYNHYYSNYRVHSPLISININKGHYRSTYSHPEQRRDGEALYSRIHADRSRDGRNYSSYNRGESRYDSRSGRDRDYSGSQVGNERRSAQGARDYNDRSRGISERSSTVRPDRNQGISERSATVRPDRNQNVGERSATVRPDRNGTSTYQPGKTDFYSRPGTSLSDRPASSRISSSSRRDPVSTDGRSDRSEYNGSTRNDPAVGVRNGAEVNRFRNVEIQRPASSSSSPSTIRRESSNPYLREGSPNREKSATISSDRSVTRPSSQVNSSHSVSRPASAPSNRIISSPSTPSSNRSSSVSQSRPSISSPNRSSSMPQSRQSISSPNRSSSVSHSSPSVSKSSSPGRSSSGNSGSSSSHSRSSESSRSSRR